MGRRALPKVDPNLDLAFHLRQLGPPSASQPQQEKILPPQEMFPRPAPLELEIGSGKGMFLRKAAAAHPERNFVGIEIAHKYAHFAASRLARDGAANAIMLSGDALRYCREFVPTASLAAVHVYFPDPWWKARHRKRRVMRADFLPEIERMLIPGGKLHFWTDVQEYFETTLELLAEHTSLEGPHEVPIEQYGDEFRTHFERRMRLHDHPVFRSEYVKRP